MWRIQCDKYRVNVTGVKNFKTMNWLLAFSAIHTFNREPHHIGSMKGISDDLWQLLAVHGKRRWNPRRETQHHLPGSIQMPYILERGYMDAFPLTLGTLPRSSPGPRLRVAGCFCGTNQSWPCYCGAVHALHHPCLTIVLWKPSKMDLWLPQDVGKARNS